MRRNILSLILAAAALYGCAKAPVAGTNESAKRVFDAWIQVHHPDAVPTALGSYIIENEPGTGEPAGDASKNPFVRLDYVVRNLDGAVQSTTDADLAHRVGIYSSPALYYPVIWSRADNALPVGIDELISAMCVGGRVKAAVPGWLGGTDRYDTAEDYVNKASGKNFLYEFTLRDVIGDIKKWETDSVGRYISDAFPGKSVLDSLKYGFYYFRTGAPSSESAFPEDTTVYINYVGRLLDGTVFDTNVRDSARFYGIYSASRTYGPCKVTGFNADGDHTGIKMDDAEVQEGFSFALSRMHAGEKGAAVFYSGLGYGSSGAGSYIPEYSPLRFDIELVDNS